MTYTVSIQTEAETEIQEAYEWYENRAHGLGDEFVRAVDASLAFIERDPFLYGVVQEPVRRVLLRRFPYGLFYFVDDDTVKIIACFHASRDPKEWQRRV